MRKFILLFSALSMGITGLKAQTVATFDTLSLPGNDTFYVNYSSPGNDVGFNDGLAYFPCVYDTAYGDSLWEYGFIYSNDTDSVTSGYTNQYSAKTAKGYNGSSNYAVAECFNIQTYANNTMLYLDDSAMGKSVQGFYVTNSTYAFNAIRDGYFNATKFDSGSWFKLTVQGYSGGALKSDSVEFYLADYRFSDTDSDYIVNTWQWVNLLPLGHVDSLMFTLTSSDTAGGYGMNTPAYFCMDNFTTNETSEGVNNVSSYIAKVYPNPATDMLYVDLTDNTIKELTIMDVAGHVVNRYAVTGAHIAINTSSLPAGMYMLQMNGDGKNASMKFVKQ